MKKKEKDSIEESRSAKDDESPIISSSSSVEVAKSSRCEDPETGDMIHTPQFHHPHHPHHRSFQVRTTSILPLFILSFSLFEKTERKEKKIYSYFYIVFVISLQISWLKQKETRWRLIVTVRITVPSKLPSFDLPLFKLSSFNYKYV